MMNEVDMSGWADLIHSSTKLLEHAPPVQFPPLQRNLDQLEALSKKLKVKTLGAEIPTESIAAARLLAREGINAEHLSRDLKSSFEIKTAPEDAFPSKPATVDEYLQQVREKAMMSAIEEAQKDNLTSFNNYMMKVSEEDWEKEKRDFLQSLSRISVLPRKNYVKDALPGEQQLVPVSSSEVTQSKATAYQEVVKRHNYCRERDLLFKPATVFRSAYEGLGLERASGKSVTMHKIWCLIQSLVEGDSRDLHNISKKMQFVIGARHHLELGHQKYITDTIHSHPSQAMLGGGLGNLQKIHAFLRVRLRDYGPLDFDAHDAHRRPPVDTTWQQIYFCLRSGYYNEAKKVAASSRASRDFSAMLNAWISTGGSAVPAQTATAASGECDRMWAMVDRGGRVAYDKKRLLLYALLSSSRRQLDRILRELPNMFSTIEDFLWFNSASVRDDTTASPSSDPPCHYRLEDLQSHLNKFDPSYYTKNGKDPLVYPYVLLLTIQLLPAVLFMAKEEGCNSDAAHIAIALASHAAFSPPSAATEVSHMIRQYGSEYLRVGNPAAALEYYAESAAAIGAGAAFERQKNLMLTQLLTELLLRDSGILLLLGPAGSGEDGELLRFLPDARQRRQFLLEASQHCIGAGLDDRSIEIHKRIGAFSDALDTVNRCLSDAVCALSRGTLDGESRIAALLHSGNDVIDAFRRCHGDVGAREWDRVGEQQTVLRQLEAILSAHQLAQLGRHSDALLEISRLPFLHLDDAMQTLSPHVLSCVPSVLRVALTCLENKNLPDSGGSPFPAMRAKIANILANNMHRNWPRDLYEIVARSL